MENLRGGFQVNKFTANGFGWPKKKKQLFNNGTTKHIIDSYISRLEETISIQ